MSLVRLLAIGQSLDAMRETTSRYRVSRQNLLPRFGAALSATPFVLTRKTGADGRGSVKSCSVFWLTALKRLVSQEKAELIRVQPREGVLKFVNCVRTAKERILRSFTPLVEKLSAIRLPAHRRFSAITQPPPSPAGSVQAELSLDCVKVVRNDLSDADLEVVPIETNGGPTTNSRPGEFEARRMSANERWGQLAKRLKMPVGYQDKSGFHFGFRPAEKEADWPPFW